MWNIFKKLVAGTLFFELMWVIIQRKEKAAPQICETLIEVWKPVYRKQVYFPGLSLQAKAVRGITVAFPSPVGLVGIHIAY